MCFVRLNSIRWNIYAGENILVKQIAEINSLRSLKFSKCFMDDEGVKELTYLSTINKCISEFDMSIGSDSPFNLSLESVEQCKSSFAKNGERRRNNFSQCAYARYSLLIRERALSSSGSVFSMLPVELVVLIMNNYSSLLAQRTKINVVYPALEKDQLYIRGNFGGLTWEHGKQLKRLDVQSWEIILDEFGRGKRYGSGQCLSHLLKRECFGSAKNESRR